MIQCGGIIKEIKPVFKIDEEFCHVKLFTD